MNYSSHREPDNAPREIWEAISGLLRGAQRVYDYLIMKPYWDLCLMSNNKGDDIMNLKLFILPAAIVLIGAIVLGVFSMSSNASPPENASGSWYYIPPMIPEEEKKIVGGNTILTGTEVGNWTGTFHGDSQDCFDMDPPILDCAESKGDGGVTIHPDGHMNYTATILFSLVSVDDKNGGLELRVNGKFPNASSEWEGQWVIIGGTGELANLHGQGTWWGPGFVPPPEGEPPVPGVLHYSGNVLFAPD